MVVEEEVEEEVEEVVVEVVVAIMPMRVPRQQEVLLLPPLPLPLPPLLPLLPCMGTTIHSRGTATTRRILPMPRISSNSVASSSSSSSNNNVSVITRCRCSSWPPLPARDSSSPCILHHAISARATRLRCRRQSTPRRGARIRLHHILRTTLACRITISPWA